MCRSLLDSGSLVEVSVALPPHGLAEITAWVEAAAGAALQGESADMTIDGVPTSWSPVKVVASDTVYLWDQAAHSGAEAAVAELSHRLEELTRTQPNLTDGGSLGRLREHLDRAMDDREVSVGTVYGSYQLSVGFGTYGLENAAFHFWGSRNASVAFGRFCSLAPDVEFFLDGNHQLGAASTYPFRERGARLGWPAAAGGGRDQNNGRGPIALAADVWAGRGAVFLSGVRVGVGAVVGTRAVVTRDVPPYAVVAGNPARVVRYRFDEATVARLVATRWWTWGHARLGRAVEMLSADAGAFLAWAEAGGGLNGTADPPS